MTCAAHPRPFSPTDSTAVLELAARSYTPDSRWYVGDLAWHLAVSGGHGLGDRTDVWSAATGHGRRPLVAVSWWDRIVVDDETRVALTFVGPTTLLPRIVEHAMAELDDDVAAVDVVVLAVETDVAEALQGLGFRPTDAREYFVNLQLDLADLPADEPEPAAPAGIHIVRGDVVSSREWVELQRAVWPDSALTVEGRVAMVRRWPYDPSYDLVAVTDDGTPVCSVLGWLPPGGSTGQLEPVGTLPAWRRRGLTRVVGRQVLAAFRAGGASRGLVYARGDAADPAPRAAYAALGFAPHTRQHRWQRRVRPAPGTAPAEEQEQQRVARLTGDDRGSPQPGRAGGGG